jgi:rhamnose transport system permease protein
MAERLRAWHWEVVLGAILVGVVIANVSLSPFYLDGGNAVNLFQLSIEKVIVAVVMTFVIINGEIDLSVASVMAFSACVLADLHSHGVSFALAVVVALAAGAAAGFLQGIFVAKFGLPSLVVTLAGLIGFRGAARILLEDRSIGDFPEWFDRLGQDKVVGPVPVALVIFVVGLVVAGIILHRTAFGRSLYVIGNSADVARYSGIDVARVKLIVMTSSGFVAGLAGVLFAARLGSVRGDLALGFELDIITMVLLGGVSIFGGSGTLVGVALAILIVLNLRNGLGLANVEANIQTGIIGAILILSVLVPNLVARFAGRRHRAEPETEPSAVVGPERGGDSAQQEADLHRVVSTERRTS